MTAVKTSTSQKRVARTVLCAGLFAILAGCSTLGDYAASRSSKDPLEPVNRGMHAVNKGVDTVVLRPVSMVYGTVIPARLRTGIGNLASNLGEPANFVNNLLQARLDQAATNGTRFLINSTIGVLGLLDVATLMGIEGRPADFGETLHVWGAGEGAYLELPLFGPSTTRDATGLIVDFAMNPFGYLSPSDDVLSAARRVRIADTVGLRYSLRSTIDAVLYDSTDSYAQSRLIYLQNRRFELNDFTTGDWEAVNGEGQAPSASDPYADPYLDPYADPYSQ
ncbi:MAG: VacJ family lipoprotein [Proteobacteria bacterium]|nr:VacJ family lipoprotein [Pseudomonadota bacterium]